MKAAIALVVAVIILLALLGLLYWVAVMFVAERFAVVIVIVVGLLCVLSYLKYGRGGGDVL